MHNLSFYTRHALNNMNRNRQRTFFVLFCIAAGVAAVVSLRSLGLMIQSAVLENLQEELSADLRITPPSSFTIDAREDEIDEELISSDGSLFGTTTFSDVGIERIFAWADANGYEASAAQFNSPPIQIRRAENADSAEAITLFLVDETQYPFYGEVAIVEPAGMTLEDALSEPKGVAIPAELADKLEIGVGDEVRLTGAAQPFTVTALVDDLSEASLTNIQTLLIPFAYFSFDQAQELFNQQADTIFVRVDAGADVVAIEEAFDEEFGGLGMRTTDDLREVNQSLTDWLTKLITTMGLVSLLIGGIGIINTMLVVVRRRTLEIGVLKTIGLQGRQITIMFLIEAFLMGILGSVLGILLGLGLTRILQGVGEQLAARSLSFAIFPEALIMGLIVGTIVTVVFGFLPTLSAGRVRPNVVLNPTGDNPIPAGARWQSLLAILAVILVLGAIVGFILDNYVLGFGGTVGVFVALGIVGLLMWVIVLFLTILPSFGSVRIKLAQRAMATHRGRTASTLLALVVGMFALSLILLLTQSILSVINASFDQQLGGNILAIGQSYDTIIEIQETADELPGINEVTFDEVWNGELVAINGETDLDATFEQAREAAVEQYRTNAGDEIADLTEEELADRESSWETRSRFALAQFTDQLFLQKQTEELVYTIQDGSDVSAETSQGIAIRLDDAVDWLGIEVGDTLTFRFEDGQETTLNVVGTFAPISVSDVFRFEANTGPPAGAVISEDAIPDGAPPIPGAVIIDADEEVLNETIVAISEIPGVFVFEATLIESFITTILDQLTALPLVVAILSLFASGVIIANTVSLATLERRREIGIMKALGMSGNQVLSLLVIENGLLGLLGGILGTSIGTGISLWALLSDDTIDAQFPLMTLVWLLLLAVGIAIGATLITAIGASREKPLIVLRYE